MMNQRPNNFSFNSPYGACPVCTGLGIVEEITEDSIIPDKKLSISRGGILPLGEYRDIWIFKKVEAILKRYKLTLTTPDQRHPQGSNENFTSWRRCTRSSAINKISWHRMEHEV